MASWVVVTWGRREEHMPKLPYEIMLIGAKTTQTHETQHAPRNIRWAHVTIYSFLHPPRGG